MSLKWCIVVGDGMADQPNPQLNGRTPLDVARTPAMDLLARDGQLGLIHTSPSKLEPGSGVANMTIAGYDPLKCYTGRAPLEALATGLELAPDDLVFRCNLVSTYDNLLADHCAGHITTPETEVLIDALNHELADDRLEFICGDGYRNLMLVRGAGDLKLETTPPHTIVGKPIDGHMPRGADAAPFVELIHRSRELLHDHEINATRRDLGENPGNMAWLWGQGHPPQLEPFRERFGLRGAVISAVDVVRGLGVALGWKVIDVPGATGGSDTDYQAKGEWAIEALKTRDLVYVHVEAPDTLTHRGELQKKVKAIEAIDREIVTRVLEAFEPAELRLAVLSDHVCSLVSRSHTRDPVPFAAAGGGILPCHAPAFSESHARKRRRYKRGAEWIAQLTGGVL